MRQHLPMAFAAMLMACCLPSVLSQKVFPNISSAYKQLSGNANNSAPPADLLQAAVASDEAAAAGHADHEPCHLTVAGFEWSHVQNPIIIATFLFFSAITKICFHHAGYLVTKIPESCLLIVLGTIAGTIFTFSTDTDSFPEDLKTLRPDLFFLVLLPPIVLEASYSLHNRVFFDNIGSILVFAVVGTIISCFFIGPILYGLSYAGALPGGDKVSFIHCMLFASIIVAVDPVAVLAIFQEVGVNSVLYFLVFGESLLNDAVTLVLYNTVEGINCLLEEGRDTTALTYVTAVFKFFATSLGGVVIGIVYGTITSLLTKYTLETRVIEPLVLFSMAYMSYASSELFQFSGIVGITVCGLIQAQYAFHNISHKSYVTVKYFTKMASSAADSVIFLYLGLNLVRLDHEWHYGFIIGTILLTLLGRFLVTYSLSLLVNKKRLRNITKREQFIMAYGGLRGAVAFSLVSLLTGKLDQKIQSMFMTTTLVVIIFTVFIQGGTIKPLVSLLDIRTKEKEEEILLFQELNANVTDHVMAGIEEIVGTRGQFFFYDWFVSLDDKYIKHKLQRNPLRKDEKIMKIYEKIALKQHFANLRGTEIAENFIMKQSMSEDGLYNIESIPSVHPTASESYAPPRAARPSLLSQLTRYGNVEEPEQVDDIAYITPEMLDDEEMTALQQRRLSKQQTIIESDLKNAQQLRMLFSKPGSSMDAREMQMNNDMDDRSNLMYLLQEKNKRLERFKRSVSYVGADNSSIHMNAGIGMSTIHEGPSSQIVRKPTVSTQESRQGQKSRKTVFGSKPSTASNVYGRYPAVPSSTDAHSSSKYAKDSEKKRRLKNLHSMKSLSNRESDLSVPGLTQKSAESARSKLPQDQNNSSSVDSTDRSRKTGHVQLQGNWDTQGETSELLKSSDERDIELGEVTHLDVPVARSSQSEQFPATVEHSQREMRSKSSDASLVRQSAVSQSESDESDDSTALLEDKDNP